MLLGNWVYFIGAALVYKRRRDIEIEYFYNFLGRKAKKVFDIGINALSFYFLVVVLYYGFRLLSVQSLHSTHGLNIPNHYFSMPLVIGTVSILFILLRQFLEIFIDKE
jgi:TRAP-type C4-dicarboxylate transport system permease small subunit